MSQKWLFVAGVLTACCGAPVHAQLTMNPNSWREGEGLAVASAQQVTAKATKLRLFTTLTATDKDARRAVSALAERKAATKEKLQSLDVKPDAISIRPTRLLEWNERVSDWWWSDPVYSIEVRRKQPGSYTAYAAVQVEWKIELQESDEMILLPVELIERLRRRNVFGLGDDPKADAKANAKCGIVMLFVGEISEESADGAMRRAIEEANAQAAKVATAMDKSLGRLLSVSPQEDGAWGYEYATSYRTRYWIKDRDNGDIPSPLVDFTHSPSEVFGSDPTQLQRTYSMELRYELK